MATIITDKFIYMHPPKTGGTTVSSLIMEQVPNAIHSSGHTRFQHIAKRNDVAGKTVVATVRHPLDRFFSLWNSRTTDLGFEEWTDAIVHKKLHWFATWPQVRWLPSDRRRLYLIRYEDFEREIESVFDLIELRKPTIIPHYRRSTSKVKASWQEYFRTIPMHAEMLYNFYRQDFDRLNYKLEEIYDSKRREEHY